MGGRAKQSTRRCHNNCRGFGHSRRPGGDKNHSYPCDHRRYGRIGLVNSMARPNGNTTGVSILATELDDIETRTAQRSRRPSTWRRHPALQRLNVLASLMLYANRQLIIDRVAAVRLPAIYQRPETAEEGGFVGYGSRLVDLWRNVLPRRLAQLAFSWKAVSYRSRPRVRSQPPMSMACLNGPPNHLPHQTTCPRSPRARDLLAPVYGWFTEGFDTVSSGTPALRTQFL
jgi:hypothetical protein